MPLRSKSQALDLLASKGFQAGIIVDVGAHFETEGLYSTFPDAHYIMIEPVGLHEPALARLCSQLMSAEYLIAAAGAEPGELSLAADPAAPLHTALASEAPRHWLRSTVPILTIDSVLAKARARHAGSALIKIDVDGPEMSVLAGCEQILAQGQDAFLVEAALLDTDEGRFGQIVTFMAQRGYEVFDIIEPLLRPADNVLWQVDLLLVPREFRGRASRRYK